MPIVDPDDRVFALVSVVNLLTVLLGIAVGAAGSTLALSQSLAGALTAVVVAGLPGLVFTSKWYHDVSRETVKTAIRDAEPCPCSECAGG